MTLQTELQTDPLGRGYATMAHIYAVQDSLNAVDRTSAQETYVTDRILFSRLGPTVAESILGKMEASTDPAVKRATAWVTSPTGFNIGDPVTQVMIDSLTTAGLFTADEGAALKALAVKPCSRAQELGINADGPSVYAAMLALGWVDASGNRL